jgi:glycosyltransferase involved in cell wall biosynthesis
MDRDGVTIAIPNWNHELLLPRSIDSALRSLAVLRQEGVAGEVFVVDDGSRDGSRPLLRQLEAMYYREGLRVLFLPSNQGLARARNQGLANARYPYVVLMDADNEIIPENLPYFLRALRQTNAAAVYGTLLYRTVTSQCAYHVTSNESFQSVQFERDNINAFALFDRDQLRDVGGCDDSGTIQEDAELCLHLAAQGRRLVFVPMVFGYYYILPGSMRGTPSEDGPAKRQRQRMYNQVSARRHLPLNTERLRYHPATGYL